MKKLLLTILSLSVLVSGLLFSSSMEVLKTDGTTVSIELDEITNITFITGGTPPPEGMILIPAGSFDMGDHFGEGMSYERPIHTVNLNSYYMATHEVTQLEYETLIGSNPSVSYGIDDDFPVYWVSWYSTLVYCNKLSISESLTPCYTIAGSTNPDDWGDVPDITDPIWNSAVCDFNAIGYRLPTEAEWEYAAKGGANWEDHNRYVGCVEQADLENYAWYTYTPNVGTTVHTVGTKLPNQLGLYDMSGNISEWCYDWYDASYYENSPANSPTGPTSGSTRIMRGGFWNGAPSMSRCSDRTRQNPSFDYYYMGFRLVRTSE